MMFISGGGSSGGGGSAPTTQQVVDDTSTLAVDSSPTDADKLIVNQAGVGKTLALSTARTQLDVGVSGGRTINGDTASTGTLTLGNNALPVVKATGVAAATDFVQITSSASGGGDAGPKIAATGSDPTVDLLFDVKGASARYDWRVNGTTKMDLNSGGGAGAALRVSGDVLTQIGGGKFGTTTEAVQINNGGSWVDLVASNAVTLRISSGLGSSTGPIMFIPNLTVEPTVNPIGGAYIYCFGGAIKARGSAGTVTTIAPA